MNEKKFKSKSEQALYGIYLLDEEGKRPITVEDLAVKLWTVYKKEFCMNGYPQYPNVDIQKHLTKLFTSNLIKGGVVNYILTDKGKKAVEYILKQVIAEEKSLSSKDVSINRELRTEIHRIKLSKVYKYYTSEKEPEFIQMDFFDFLGTSPRSLHDKRNSNFLSKINLIRNDLVEYCEQNKSRDSDLEKIYTLWHILFKQYGELLK